MASKGLLAVLLAAGAFLAGAAISFCGIQTAMISSGFGDSWAGPGSCDPAFRLPVSLETMHGIDAAVVGIVAAAYRIPAKNLLDAMPFRRRRLVRNLATGALYIGVLVPFPALPTCPVTASACAAAAAAGPASCGDCYPMSRAALLRFNVAAVAILAAACISVYVSLNYLDRDDDNDDARED